MHERENALKEWLNAITQTHQVEIKPLAGDASFRRYYRVRYNGLSQIVMDAPPAKEDVAPFIHICHLLSQAGIHVPEIKASNLQQGFLLLSDLGDALLLDSLTVNTADRYYQQAMDILLSIQQCSTKEEQLPLFDKQFMLQEMNLFTEWFLTAYLKLQLTPSEATVLTQTMDWIAMTIAEQPQVFIHRDYHSRNLMITDDQQLGVIDFQDAMQGPITYDLASLLKDCYISWPRKAVLAWVTYFYNHNATANNHYCLDDFIRAFDLCGIQRHLKVLGIFCRLHLRDGKERYLADLPLILRYALECTESYEELQPLFNFLQKRVELP